MNKNILFPTLILLFCFGTACKKELTLTPPENIKIKNIEASSTLEENLNKNYISSNLTEQSEKSWCEGKADDGIGETLKINFDNKVVIDRLFIRNGFGDTDFFSQNNRAKTITFSTPEKQIITSDIPDRISAQEIKLGQMIETDALILRIDSVYKGTKYKDTCIHEIAFDLNKIKKLKKPSEVCKENGGFFEFGDCVKAKSHAVEKLIKISSRGFYKSDAFSLPVNCADRITIQPESKIFYCGGAPANTDSSDAAKFPAYTGTCKTISDTVIECKIDNHATFRLKTEKDWDKFHLCVGSNCHEFAENTEPQ